MGILEYKFVQNAIVGIFLISIVSAIIGTYIVARRRVFISGGITHASFGGLGLGYYLGVSPVAIAAIFAVVSSLAVEMISANHKMRTDSAIGVVWALGMALGTLFIFMTPGYVPELNSFLFGNILTITNADLIAFSVFAVFTIAFFSMFYRAIVICAFDNDFARTIYLPTKFINCTMMILVSIGIVLAIRLVGIMLLISLFTLPQLIAEIYVHRLKSIIFLSAIISVAGSMLGLISAFYIDVPVSATIVLAFVIFYALAYTMKKLILKA